MGNGDLHMVIWCIESPIRITLPLPLNPLGGGQSNKSNVLISVVTPPPPPASAPSASDVLLSEPVELELPRRRVSAPARLTPSTMDRKGSAQVRAKRWRSSMRPASVAG